MPSRRRFREICAATSRTQARSSPGPARRSSRARPGPAASGPRTPYRPRCACKKRTHRSGRRRREDHHQRRRRPAAQVVPERPDRRSQTLASAPPPRPSGRPAPGTLFMVGAPVSRRNTQRAFFILRPRAFTVAAASQHGRSQRPAAIEAWRRRCPGRGAAKPGTVLPAIPRPHQLSRRTAAGYDKGLQNGRIRAVSIMWPASSRCPCTKARRTVIKSSSRCLLPGSPGHPGLPAFRGIPQRSVGRMFIRRRGWGERPQLTLWGPGPLPCSAR